MTEANVSIKDQAAINPSVDKAHEEAETEGASKQRVSCLLKVIGGIALACVFIWLLFGRISSYYYESQAGDLREQSNNQTATITKMEKNIKELTQNIAAMTKTVEGLKNKNQYLKSELELKNATIESLKSVIAQKDLIIADLSKTNENLTSQVDFLKRKNEALNNQIEELKDEVAEYYNDARMVTSLLNTQLNRNQALEKGMDSLEEKNEKLEIEKTQMFWKMANLTNDMQELAFQSAENWVKTQIIIRKKAYTKVVLEKVFSNNGPICERKTFMEAIKDKKPNLFLAMEASTGLIFGGYTTKEWNTAGDNEFLADPDAFTFSASSEQVCPVKAGNGIRRNQSRNEKKVIQAFGNGFEIVIQDSCITAKNNEVNARTDFDCPPNAKITNFYTMSKNPTILKYKFYRVEETV